MLSGRTRHRRSACALHGSGDRGPLNEQEYRCEKHHDRLPAAADQAYTEDGAAPDDPTWPSWPASTATMRCALSPLP